MLREEAKLVKSFQEVVITHGSPSSLAARVAKLKDALRGVEECYEVASAYIKENFS